MTKRHNFSKAVKVACLRRSTRESVTYCEGCGAMAKCFEIDHVDPDGLTGKPTLDNAMLLCLPCHADKTGKDVAAIAKAKRREAQHIGAKPAPRMKIANRGFAPTGKVRQERAALPPRQLYERVK